MSTPPIAISDAGRLPPPLARGELAAQGGDLLGKVRWYRPILRSLTLADGSRAVVKDFRSCPWFWRSTYGRVLTRREVRAYERLAGIDGIPRFLGRIDRYAIALEWVPGTMIGKLPYGSLRAETYERLVRTVEAMHARGVLHMDLRGKKNVLVDGAGTPCALDFSSAFISDRRTRFGRWLFRHLALIDESALLKLKRRFVAGGLTEADQARLRTLESLRWMWPF
jgi:tRNA A-37 threonylcarbamoyl transferase component Bud32